MTSKRRPDQRNITGNIPCRAFGDKRLNEIHFRLLGAIATFDRMSMIYGGEGCWASMRALAHMTAMHPVNLSGAATDLVKWGYIEQRPHPRDGRRKTQVVVYTEGDDAWFNLAVGKPAGSSSVAEPPIDRKPRDLSTTEDRKPYSPEIVSRPAGQAVDNTGGSYRKRNKRYEEKKRGSPECASPISSDALARADSNVGGWLAQVERQLPRLLRLPQLERLRALNDLYPKLEKIAGDHDAETGDPNGGRAFRLQEEIGERIYELTGET